MVVVDFVLRYTFDTSCHSRGLGMVYYANIGICLNFVLMIMFDVVYNTNILAYTTGTKIV